jgi:hypothetical protein
MSTTQTISINTMYERKTNKHSLRVDTELLNALRVDLYKSERTHTTALELLDWLQTCLDRAEQDINK